MNMLITEDGYLFEQLPNGLYTDGDVEFNYDLCENFSGIVWQDYDGQWCADGDGMVVVVHDGKQYVVTDQGDPVYASEDLTVALYHAMQQLRAYYPEVYESCIPYQN